MWKMLVEYDSDGDGVALKGSFSWSCSRLEMCAAAALLGVRVFGEIGARSTWAGPEARGFVFRYLLLRV